MKHLMATMSLAAVLSLVPSGVHGQSHPQTRDGFWFNIGLGYGSLGCENCDTRTGGGSGGLAVGGAVNQKWSLGVGANGWTKSENGVTLSAGTFTFLARFYPSATGGFFLLGGLGYGNVDLGLAGFGNYSQSGGGALLGLGWDVRVGENLSITPFWNGYAVSLDRGNVDVGQLGVGLTIH